MNLTYGCGLGRLTPAGWTAQIGRRGAFGAKSASPQNRRPRHSLCIGPAAVVGGNQPSEHYSDRRLLERGRCHRFLQP